MLDLIRWEISVPRSNQALKIQKEHHFHYARKNKLQKFLKTMEDHLENQAVESWLAKLNEDITKGKVDS